MDTERINVADLRARLGLSALEMAEELGITRQRVYQLEKGESPSGPLSLLLERLSKKAARNG